MNITVEIIWQIILGGLLGALGQGLRVIVGLVKLNSEAKDKKTTISSLIDTSRLLLSLLIGFCAGALAMIGMTTFKADFLTGDKVKEVLMGIIAAGYAGTDFIEGFMRKSLPADPARNNNPKEDEKGK